jgi:hypothetical protein
VNWFTIYDVRDGWAIWIVGILTVVLVGVGSLILVGTVRLARAVPGQSQKPPKPFAAAVVLVIFVAEIALSLWFMVSDHLLRADLNSGRFMETEGLIDGAHIEGTGRSKTMYFRIGDRWFELPFRYSPECYPHNGDVAKIAFESAANVKHAGPDAHVILRMQMTHACKLPIWG